MLVDSPVIEKEGFDSSRSDSDAEALGINIKFDPASPLWRFHFFDELIVELPSHCSSVATLWRQKMEFCDFP